MNYEEKRKLINNIIENEFTHIQIYRELNDLKKDKERLKESEESSKLFKKLLEGASKEYQEMLDDYYSAVISELVSYCRYYFKEGVAAGTSNLNFIRDITDGIDTRSF